MRAFPSLNGFLYSTPPTNNLSSAPYKGNSIMPKMNINGFLMATTVVAATTTTATGAAAGGGGKEQLVAKGMHSMSRLLPTGGHMEVVGGGEHPSHTNKPPQQVQQQQHHHTMKDASRRGKSSLGKQSAKLTKPIQPGSRRSVARL
jgi:hypothetical protein